MPPLGELEFFLKNAIENPKYIASDTLTFCNYLVQDTFNYFGYKGFEGLTANKIFDYCEVSQDFQELRNEECIKEIKKHGYLIVAACKGYPHGHVAIVFPGESVYSAKWGIYVPRVASTGSPNRIAGVNWFFKELPAYFRLRESPDIG